LIKNWLVPYRGDETDPLENIIRQRRAMRRVVLLVMVMGILPSLRRLDYLRLVLEPLRAPTSTAAPITAPVTAPKTEQAPTATPRRKLTAAEVERQLRAIASTDGPEDPRCSPGLSGWDYFCSYRTGGSPAAKRVKIGVLVGPTDIVHASVPYPIDRTLPTAPVVGAP
jgi:hypothetical protein